MEIVDIYCRVSTHMQAAEGYSLEEQEDLLRKYAESQKWQINAVLVDGGYTGKNMDRPALQSLIRDAQQKKISKVLVYKMDRLSRSQKEMLYILEDILIPNGVAFVSMTESLDTSTPLGMAMIGILAAFAQLERSQITERMMLGRTARAKDGYFHGTAYAPIGYDYDSASKQLIPSETESEFVRSMFQMYIDGETASSIAKHMNNVVVFRGHKTWSASNVIRTLQNPIYCGVHRWKGELMPMNEDHQCLISRETFDQVQEIMRRRSTKTDKPQSSYKHVSMLGGIMWCGKCGARFGSFKDKSIYRYYCLHRTSYHKVRGIEKCMNKGWTADALDQIVLGEIRKLSADRSLISDIDKRKSRQAEERNAIKTRIKEIDKQYDRLIDLFMLGKFDAAAINKRTEALQNEKSALEEKLNSFESPSTQIDQIMSKLDTFEEIIDHSKPIDMHNIVHDLIKSITLDDDNVSIIWNFE